jgi:hypothetical protein
MDGTGSPGVTAKTMGLQYTLNMDRLGFVTRCEVHNMASDLGSQFLLHSSHEVAVGFRQQFSTVPARDWLKSYLERLEVSNGENFRRVITPALQWAVDLCLADAEEDAGKWLEQNP